jgi:hypothetical protein
MTHGDSKTTTGTRIICAPGIQAPTISAARQMARVLRALFRRSFAEKI